MLKALIEIKVVQAITDKSPKNGFVKGQKKTANAPAKVVPIKAPEMLLILARLIFLSIKALVSCKNSNSSLQLDWLSGIRDPP